MKTDFKLINFTNKNLISFQDQEIYISRFFDSLMHFILKSNFCE